MKVSFTIPGRIGGQRRIRHNGKQHFMDAKTRSDRAYVSHFASQAMYGETLLDGPLALDVLVFIQPPLSWSKKKRAAAQFVTGKPDCDNVLKLLSDAMNGVVYADDSQIAQVRMTRRYTLELEHVSVEILALEAQASEHIPSKRSGDGPSNQSTEQARA